MIQLAKRIRKIHKMGVREISIHNLRHTYATTLISDGFDFETVAELMGIL